MTLNEYQALAQRTSSTQYPFDKISNGCMGMCGEAGETIDILKKYEWQGHQLDAEKLIDEAGDCLWYIAELACGLGVTLEGIAKHNLEKLKKRYPDGFSADKSVNREV